MASKYDKNGYGGGDFKRNTQHAEGEQDGEGAPQLNEKTQEYLRELLAEKLKADQGNLINSVRLLEQEITRVQATGKPLRDNKYADVYRDKPINVRVKVLVPVKEHPKFNFVGNLLGPKGNTVKALQEETMCKMAIFGKGSVRDRNEEEKMRNSLDPKYSHLTDELHVEISALAPPAEAYARMAFALAEVRKYLIPDLGNQGQDGGYGEPPMGRGRGPPPPMRGPPVGAPIPPPPPPPQFRQAPNNRGPGGPGGPRHAGASKGKVLSILDRARSAMQNNYGYEDNYESAPPPPPPRMHGEEDYGYGYDAPPPAQQRDYYRETPNAITTEHDTYYSGNQDGGYGGAVSSSRPFNKQQRGGAGGHQQGNGAPNRRGGMGGGRDQQQQRPFRSAPYARPKK